MTDILRRSMAPITDEAWKEIDQQATRILKGDLSARGVVDFSGPHGWSVAAVNLGTVKPAVGPAKGVHWGLREVLPLVEVRVPFTLGIWELDNVARGMKNPKLDAMIAAARKIAIFEDSALYNGFAEGGIHGVADASTHAAVPFSLSPDKFAEAVEGGVLAIEQSGIGGPYTLVLGTAPYKMYMLGDPAFYPLKKRVESIASGGIRWSPAIQGGMVVSRRGGDYEMTVGQDLAIGYHSHDRENVDLYFTESFTFRVLEPAAGVELKLRK